MTGTIFEETHGPWDAIDEGEQACITMESIAVARLQNSAYIALRRTFSIAITAWSANVVTSSICLSVTGRAVTVTATDRGLCWERSDS